jgi:hypothetical protein
MSFAMRRALGLGWLAVRLADHTVARQSPNLTGFPRPPSVMNITDRKGERRAPGNAGPHGNAESA